MRSDRKVAVTGVGTSEFARVIADKTASRLRVEAALNAMADAGLTNRDIDGVLTGEGSGTAGNQRGHLEFAMNLGIFPKTLCMAVPLGGASPGFQLHVARWAIESGLCRNVLVVSGFKESSAGRSGIGHGFTESLSANPIHSASYEVPYGPLLISYHAVLAQRHMYEYGTTSEQLAAVAVACRKHAAMNPDAVYRNSITIEDVVSSRMITSPLHMLDCCMINDGAVAFVVSSAESVRSTRTKPVWVIGSGGGHSAYDVSQLAQGIPGDPTQEYNLVRTTAKLAGNHAFGEAGVTREEMDFVMLTDNFTISVIVVLEDLGFCKKGEGGSFVEGGRIELGGALPVNTHGGLLSCNHAATNYQNIVEAVRQLRGECGNRQVQGAKMGLAVTSAGISSTHEANILTVD